MSKKDELISLTYEEAREKIIEYFEEQYNLSGAEEMADITNHLFQMINPCHHFIYPLNQIDDQFFVYRAYDMAKFVLNGSYDPYDEFYYIDTIDKKIITLSKEEVIEYIRSSTLPDFILTKLKSLGVSAFKNIIKQYCASFGPFWADTLAQRDKAL